MNEAASPALAVDRSGDSRRWRAALAPALLVLAAFSFAMYTTGASLAELWWNSDGYGHGLIVVVVMAWLLYLRGDEFAAIEPRASVAGLVVSAALMAVWFASSVLAVLIGEQVILVFLLLSVVWALLGWRVARLAALPVLYLFCAVPVWSYLVPVLQDSTAQASTWMSRALGVPLYLEGVYMTIPDGVFLVAEVCAGISYLLAALSLGAFYALLNLRRTGPRLVIVAFSIVLGVVFNWVRVTGIVLIGHHSQMKSPLVNDHITFGWVLFVLVVIAVMAMGRYLERFDEFVDESAAHTSDSAGQSPASDRRTIWTMAIVCCVLLVTPALVAAMWTAPPANAIAVTLPQGVAAQQGWSSGGVAADGWNASLQGADAQARASFVNDPWRVDVQMGYFATQRQGAEAVNDRHALFDWEFWRRVSLKTTPDRIAITPLLTVNEIAIRNNESSRLRLVWWWYRVDGVFTADPVQAKVLQVRALLSGRRAAAVYVMSAPVVGKMEKTRDTMRAWLKAAAEPLQAGFIDKP